MKKREDYVKKLQEEEARKKAEAAEKKRAQTKQIQSVVKPLKKKEPAVPPVSGGLLSSVRRAPNTLNAEFSLNPFTPQDLSPARTAAYYERYPMEQNTYLENMVGQLNDNVSDVGSEYSDDYPDYMSAADFFNEQMPPYAVDDAYIPAHRVNPEMRMIGDVILGNVLRPYVEPNLRNNLPVGNAPTQSHLARARDLLSGLSGQMKKGLAPYAGPNATFAPQAGQMIGTLVQNMGVSPQQAMQMLGPQYMGLTPNLGMASDYVPSPAIARMMAANRPAIPPRPQPMRAPAIPPRPMSGSVSSMSTGSTPSYLRPQNMPQGVQMPANIMGNPGLGRASNYSGSTPSSMGLSSLDRRLEELRRG